MPITIARVLVALIVVAGATLLDAAVVRNLTVEQMTHQADLILHASITSSSAAWNADFTKIFTAHALDIKETLKGEAANNQKVYTAGGVVDRKGQHVSGEASLKTGSEYVFFLWKDKEGRHRVLGMAQGAFTVTRSEDAVTAKNSVVGLVFLNDQGEAVKAAAISQTLDSLKGSVEVTVAAARNEAKAAKNEAEAAKAAGKDGSK